MWIWTSFQVVEVLKSKNLLRIDKASPPRVPKFVPLTVNLDESPIDVEPVQTIHPVHTEPTPQTKTTCKPPSLEPSDRPSNLVLDEGYAWRTFKGIVTDNEVNECYNMSVKEFERSSIHDLFKVCLIRLCVFSVSFQNKVLLPFVHVQTMSKFYTATCLVKELATEAKTTKDKAKELNNEVLFKKWEVLRLTEDFNCLQGNETKLKNEVEELKADNIEKDTRIVYLEGQVFGFVSSLEKAHEEAIVTFKKSNEYKSRLDSHYAAGYEDFRADAKDTFPDLDFDSFKLPLATESSMLQMSFEDVNIMDDGSNEVTQGDPKSGGNAPNSSSKCYGRAFIQ